ncbi:2-amino-4-hydroxy-6-hydroxymethyldihydropteridine diphosphokinase [Thalassomonas sp. M1454]|uniref:2-amino-4-hydroxy-6- hydroxymethyldihydropteridine diphosphokinase n=1 Tax=Thalassomonas sp. M1454 TaxID=2594477 RepID=UPI00117CFD4C|nr:2-amino-4-hydroxy-6-hydroxymethyldihydropteridine diphosphokinase [Thalassomonas sp. M1454]TRX53908.1 2-amino-4-hydroxy-6-hydroxymethyldihydropteridine diphosphokinase [Thalassomonas sp. M1454]
MAKVYISIGSNIDKEQQIIASVKALQTEFDNVELSSVYECEPVGFKGDNFYNLVAGVTTDKTPAEVGDFLKSLEKAHGRIDFSKKFSARKMDLDILLYDDLVLTTPVQIPRDEITENAYVLQPLAELAGQLVHPTIQLSYNELWLNYNKTKQFINKIPFNWPEA